MTKEKIYIDFAYQGIPKTLPIESIRPLTPPEDKPSEKDFTPSPIILSPVEDDEILITQEDTEIKDVIPSIRAQRQEILLDADDGVIVTLKPVIS